MHNLINEIVNVDIMIPCRLYLVNVEMLIETFMCIVSIRMSGCRERENVKKKKKEYKLCGSER